MAMTPAEPGTEGAGSHGLAKNSGANRVPAHRPVSQWGDSELLRTLPRISSST